MPRKTPSVQLNSQPDSPIAYKILPPPIMAIIRDSRNMFLFILINTERLPYIIIYIWNLSIYCEVFHPQSS